MMSVIIITACHDSIDSNCIYGSQKFISARPPIRGHAITEVSLEPPPLSPPSEGPYTLTYPPSRSELRPDVPMKDDLGYLLNTLLFHFAFRSQA